MNSLMGLTLNPSLAFAANDLKEKECGDKFGLNVWKLECAMARENWWWYRIKQELLMSEYDWLK